VTLAEWGGLLGVVVVVFFAWLATHDYFESKQEARYGRLVREHGSHHALTKAMRDAAIRVLVSKGDNHQK
jgi:hypothetical protein